MNTIIKPITKALNQIILGKDTQVKLALTCLLANGHLLIEDLPGMGKTTLSNALASLFGLDFSRIQFTSDMLPADMLGVSIYNNNTHEFTFKQGPIFNQVVLADEINRASPKTQSALLESMEENQVSIDGQTFALPSPFFVIATQNPSFQSGTYPLPESQLDRFLMRISLGYPSFEAEKAMLKQSLTQPTNPKALASVDTLSNAQQQVQALHVSDSIIDFILRLVENTRLSESVKNPLSPRASKALLNAAKAWAFLHGRDFVIPEDVQAIFPSVAEHRMGSDLSATGSLGLSQKILEMTDPLAA